MSKTKSSNVTRRSGKSSWFSRLNRTNTIIAAAFILVFAGVGTIYIRSSRAATVNGSACVYYKFYEYRFWGSQCVKDIQFGLQRAGLYNGNIDGIFGPQTRYAVVWFGNEYNESNNGVVGTRMWNNLCILGSSWGSGRFPSVANDMGCNAARSVYNTHFGLL